MTLKFLIDWRSFKLLTKIGDQLSLIDVFQISQADEFDCLLVNFSIRARPVYHPNTGVKRKSCCFLVVNSKYITDLDSIRGPAADQTSVFISPKKIRKYFRDCVNNAIQNIDGRTIRGLGEQEYIVAILYLIYTFIMLGVTGAARVISKGISSACLRSLLSPCTQLEGRPL